NDLGAKILPGRRRCTGEHADDDVESWRQAGQEFVGDGAKLPTHTVPNNSIAHPSAQNEAEAGGLLRCLWKGHGADHREGASATTALAQRATEVLRGAQPVRASKHAN